MLGESIIYLYLVSLPLLLVLIEMQLLSAYQEALDKHSSVAVEVTRCIIGGPSAVGKSSLKHLLVHNTPKAVKTSTAVMDMPEVVSTSAEQYTVEGGNSAWQPVSKDKMGKSLHKCVRSKSYDASQYPELLDITVQIGEVVSPHPLPSPPLHQIGSVGHEVVALLDKAQANFMEEHSLEMNEGDDIIELKDASFIHLLDTGGQPSFQDALPRLLDVPSTYIQVFNAARSLDEPVRITYRPDDETEETLPSSRETGWEMMLRSFSSMQTMAHKCSKDLDAFRQQGSQLPQLRIFVVGTFKDQLIKEDRLEEAVQDISTRLEELDGKPYFEFIQWDSKGRPFYLIDNLSENGDDKAYINHLRQHLSSANSSLKVQVPVMWLKCQEITHRTPQKFLKFEDLKAFCLKQGFIDADNADSQFRALLQLFSLLGFYSFFNLKGVQDQANYICTDTGVFLKEVSKLLAVQFTTTKSAAMKRFKKTGILVFTPKLFEELGMSQEMDPYWFLEALHHLGISANLSSLGRLESFIPAVLPHTSESSNLSASVAPVYFTYKIKEGAVFSYSDLPRGVFCYLAVELIRHGWKIAQNESTRTLLKFNWKDFKILLEECPGYISLLPMIVKKISSLSDLHTSCHDLRSTVEECLSISTEAVLGSHFNTTAEIVMGFRCPCTNLSFSHLAVLSEMGDSLICNQTDEPQSCSNQHRIWFSKVEGAEVSINYLHEVYVCK